MQQEGRVSCIWDIYIYILLYGRIELFTFFVVCFRVSKKSPRVFSSQISLHWLLSSLLITDQFFLPPPLVPMVISAHEPALVNHDSRYSTVSVSNLVVSILHWVLPFLINPRRVVDLSVCSALVRIEWEIEAPYMHYWKSHHYCIWCP